MEVDVSSQNYPNQSRSARPPLHFKEKHILIEVAKQLVHITSDDVVYYLEKQKS